MNNIPRHIAIIPDGNRRWAKARGLKAWKGHIEGAKRSIELIRAFPELGIKYLTFWASSYDNLIKRPKEEISTLNKLYKDMALRFLADKTIAENNIRVRILGEWRDLLSKETVQALEKLERATAKNEKHHFTGLIGYNGDREIIQAIKKIAQSNNKEITEETIKNNLWTSSLPAVDLVVRTGGEPHLSAGFMMWDVRYAQLHFTDKLWPDFTKKDLQTTIDNFSLKKRRFGA